MYVEHKFIKPNKLEARIYQQLIAASALKDNTLVVLPTGLGKTAIAALVIAGLLTKKDGKVLIIAPTRPLVEQHYRTFKDILNIDGIVAITGKIPPAKREKIYREGKIFIATPQVIENDILSGRLKVDDFILLIADEAHHTVGNHAYAFVAKSFKDKCHILALTASPGHDVDKVMEICENLGIKRIEFRDESDEDVKPYVAKVRMIPIRVELLEEFKKALKLLDDALKERLKFLKDHGVIDSINVTKTELLELNNKLFSYDDEVKYELIKKCSEALKLMYAKELLESQGKDVFLKYIEKLSLQRSKSAKNVVCDERVKKAVNLLKSLNVEHPKYPKLLELIKSILEKNKDERIIVFAQYRDTVDKIVSLLEKNGIKAIKFIGQSCRDGKGMSQKQQVEAIERFKREGQVLVSTSVSEEGIDIPAVNYVIFFEPVPSEIRTIQRRGRAMRGEGGTCYILISKGTSDEAYYWSALKKEREMKRTLRAICKAIEKKLKEKYGEDPIKKEYLEEKEDKEEKIETKEEKKEEEKKEEPKEEKRKLTLLDFLKSSGKEEKREEEKKETGKKKIKIIVDVREKGMAKLLSEKAEVELKTLELGDYIVSDRVVIERKTDEDFVNSIIDKRLFNQLKDLKKVERPILIIEGNNFSRIHENAIKGAILSIILDYRIPIIFTKDREETADYIIKIAEREQLKEKRPVSIRYGKRAMTLQERQKFIVESLPDVGGALAERLLEHFKTVENVFTASERELMRVEGVGEERAKKIREVLTTEYKK
ncbi:DEAD/DEAH box helicase domain protein [Methanocaldococcus infernus ME]|uniref:DEAD/DEAH box helicase domain protein n=1 Tax=Methanocaldococcus infernus (strain DSM 11812 / JCM 15783 / ME) TaxID=573063 RepID=D5VTL1_METIM|nr:DEAD/DEAH box helicase [Methanocaldococcus infernus]ADG13914.1 DEAD/DEAH box helicase domain protein [Methanocaldococcus infernus ME]